MTVADKVPKNMYIHYPLLNVTSSGESQLASVQYRKVFFGSVSHQKISQTALWNLVCGFLAVTYLIIVVKLVKV